MFHGSLVAIVTPMHADGNIDYASLRNLVEWHIENRTDGIVVTGTTGEAATLSPDERFEVTKMVVQQVAERIPVIAGTGTNSTQQTIEFTRQAMEIGVNACLLVTPYYNRPTQAGLYQHYTAIAKAVPIPQLLYNIPKRTGCDLLPETIERLAEIPNIVGIKEGIPERAKAIIESCGKSLDVLSGDDDTALEIIILGGKGVISTTANVAPQLMHELAAHALAGNKAAAEKINQQLSALFKQLFVESNPIPLKWALSAMGMIQPGIRLPLTSLSETCHDAVRTALQQAGIQLEGK